MKIRGPVVILGFGVLAAILGAVYFVAVRDTVRVRILNDDSLKKVVLARVGGEPITRFQLVVKREAERVLKGPARSDADLLLDLIESSLNVRLLPGRPSLDAERARWRREKPAEFRKLEDHLRPFPGALDDLVLLPIVAKRDVAALQGKEEAGWLVERYRPHSPEVAEGVLLESLRKQHPDHPAVRAFSR